MKTISERFGFGNFLRDAAGEGAAGGAAAGGAAAGGAAAGGAAAGGATAGGAAAGGAAAGDAAAGGAAAGGAAAGHPDAGGEWFGAADLGFDDATRQFFAGKKYPDIKTALASLPQADRMARDRNVIEKPDPAKLADWKGWTELGWKEDPAEYAKAIPKPDKAGPINDAIFAKAVEAGHKHKAPPSVVQGIYSEVAGAFNQMQADAETAAAGEMKKLDTALRQEWGNDYDRKAAFAKRGMQHAGIGKADAAVLEQAMGNAGLVKHFNEFAEMLGEDRLVGGDGGGALPASVDGLKAELAKLEGDPAFLAKLNSARHPEHEAAKAQRQGILNRMAAAQSKQRNA